MIYLNYLVLTSTVPYTQMIWQYGLRWKPSVHILDISSRATLRMRILQKLAGTQWGANLKTLKQVYIGSVRPVLEYGSSTFGTAASTTLQKLDKIQNTGLRILSGGRKFSTPINEMESLAGLKSLEEQREEKIVLQAEKYKCLQRHPKHKKMSELSSYRIERSSFKKTARAMCAKHSDIMPQGEGEIEPLNATRSGRVHHKNP